MITVEGLVAGYGKIQVLKNISLSVVSGEVVTVLGANGAGKSTLLRCIQGLLQPWSGRIEFDLVDISRHSAEAVARLGLTMVPETKELFPDLSVADNLALGGYMYRREREAARRRQDTLDYVFELFPVLHERRTARASSLSGGQQQMLAIGRALMTRPRALMLDEPSLGLAPLMVRQIFSAIENLRRRGLAILLVEQNVRSALSLAERGYVLETGTVIASGRCANLLQDDSLMRAYLGSTRRPQH